MSSSRYLIFLFSFVLILGGIQTVNGHGLGTVESDIQFFKDSFFKIKVQTTPDVLSGNESEIGFEITTINHDDDTIVSDIEYFVDVSDPKTGKSILSFNGYSPDKSFHAKIIPKSEVSIIGDKNENDSWVGSNNKPLVIEAPLFIQGGLVQVDVKILSMGSESIPRPLSFETLLTIGEYIPFEIDSPGKKYNLMFATYFDKINEFYFNPQTKKLTAEMPFNWDSDFIKKIPFVHAEYYIPKTMNVFNEHEIKMTVNDIAILGTIDRSGDEEIVVHFLIPTKKLLKLNEEIPENSHDVIVFGIESGKIREKQKDNASLELGDKVIVQSSEEDWKFHLYLTPKGEISPLKDIFLNLEFRDPVTNSIIQLITYDLDVFLNGQLMESKSGLETPDGKDSVLVTFPETGAVIVRVSNVNNYDTSGEFSFKVSEAEKLVSADIAIEISQNASFPGCDLDSSCYVSSAVNIAPNQTVLWENIDSAAHTVTSGSPELGPMNIFDSGVMPPNGKFVYTFSTSGTFSYYCTLHPWMIGLVDVKNPLPSWIKNNAGWWADGAIDDNTFIQGIEFLVQNNIIVVPSTSQDVVSYNPIPEWIKNNAGWWADGAIDDNTFIQGLQFLIKNGIIQV